MKKEVELLEAARKGNVQIVQKLVLPPKSNAWTLATFGYDVTWLIDKFVNAVIFWYNLKIYCLWLLASGYTI